MHRLARLAALLLSAASLHAGDGKIAIDDLVIYEAFPRQFSRRGHLQDVTRQLQKISEYGVNVLWLMPIHPPGLQHRKGTQGSPYSVKDYFSIEPSLGSFEDLQALLSEAHRRGIKVLLDFVPNHCAWDHPYVTDHPDWFMKDEQGNPRPPNPAWTDVVQFNHTHPEVRAELEAVMAYWLDVGVDGFRVDVAGMVPDDFWQGVIPRLRKSHPGLLLMAEAVGPLYHQLGFDLSYDDPLKDRLLATARGQDSAERVAEWIRRAQEDYPPGARLLRYVENHDHDRSASAFPGETEFPAAFVTFMLPGAPLIYAGQEAGIRVRPSLFERDPVPWEDASEEAERFYRQASRHRLAHPSLRHREPRLLETSHPDQVIAFLSEANDLFTVAVANLTDRPAPGFSIPDTSLPSGCTCVFSREPATGLPESLPPASWYLLECPVPDGDAAAAP